MKKVLVVAPHPDDETLMCGGTLLKHKENNDHVYWMVVTSISTEYGWDKQIVDRRQKEISLVSKMYRFEKTFQLNFPTTQLSEVPRNDIISAISKIFNEVLPDIVYLPNRSDVHSDHQIVFQAAYACTKNFRYPFIKRVIVGETLSETEFAPPLSGDTFQPNVFVDVTDFFKIKCDIMQLYSNEVMRNPFPRSVVSIEALAKYRGSRIGVRYAEAFMLLYEKR